MSNRTADSTHSQYGGIKVKSLAIGGLHAVDEPLRTKISSAMALSNLIIFIESTTNNLQTQGIIIFNGVPTGVEVCASMQHGGPFPAATDSRFTSVGTSAIKRWVRPVSFQNWPQEALPSALKNHNPLVINRLVDNKYTSDKI